MYPNLENLLSVAVVYAGYFFEEWGGDGYSIINITWIKVLDWPIQVFPLNFLANSMSFSDNLFYLFLPPPSLCLLSLWQLSSSYSCTSLFLFLFLCVLMIFPYWCVYIPFFISFVCLLQILVFCYHEAHFVWLCVAFFIFSRWDNYLFQCWKRGFM